MSKRPWYRDKIDIEVSEEKAHKLFEYLYKNINLEFRGRLLKSFSFEPLANGKQMFHIEFIDIPI